MPIVCILRFMLIVGLSGAAAGAALPAGGVLAGYSAELAAWLG
jgi:hypothetical protein